MSIQAGVKEFMVGVGQNVPDKPTEPSNDQKILRTRLLVEEVLEFAEAAGVSIYTLGPDGIEILKMENLTFDVTGPTDFVEIADACADINYVSYGAAITYGIDLDPVEAEVQKTNLAKIPGGYKDENGKWCKPKGWVAPDIKSIIEKQYIEHAAKVFKGIGIESK